MTFNYLKPSLVKNIEHITKAYITRNVEQSFARTATILIKKNLLDKLYLHNQIDYCSQAEYLYCDRICYWEDIERGLFKNRLTNKFSIKRCQLYKTVQFNNFNREWEFDRCVWCFDPNLWFVKECDVHLDKPSIHRNKNTLNQIYQVSEKKSEKKSLFQMLDESHELNHKAKKIKKI